MKRATLGFVLLGLAVVLHVMTRTHYEAHANIRLREPITETVPAPVALTRSEVNSPKMTYDTTSLPPGVGMVPPGVSYFPPGGSALPPGTTNLEPGVGAFPPGTTEVPTAMSKPL